MRLPLLALAGCIDYGLDPKDDPRPPIDLVAVTETFIQEPEPGVDVLFVVDDTASMAQEQAALATEFVALAAILDDLGVSWQVGVATTDMSAEDAAWLQGSPYVLTSSTPEVEDRFAEIVQVGTSGAAPEAGFAAALQALALSAPGGPNAGFRRADASLHVVFVSDADDASDLELGADPVVTFVDALAAEAERTGLPVVASAIAGDVPNGCVSDRGTAVAGGRYQQAAERTGGVVVSICDTEFDPLLEAIGEVSVVLGRRFPLQERPVPETVRVTVDGIPADRWTLDDLDPAVIFESPPPASARIVVDYVVEST